jgi:hypothetical protein
VILPPFVFPGPIHNFITQGCKLQQKCFIFVALLVSNGEKSEISDNYYISKVVITSKFKEKIVVKYSAREMTAFLHNYSNQKQLTLLISLSQFFSGVNIKKILRC